MIWLNYTISINGYSSGKLSILNKSSDFIISGTVDAPNGFSMILRFGAARSYRSTVVGGAFSFNVPVKVLARSYTFYLSMRDKNSKNIDIRKIGNTRMRSQAFNIEFVDTIAPTFPSGLVFSRGLGIKKDKFRLTWNRSLDEFKVNRYDIYKNGLLIASSPYTSHITNVMSSSDVDAYRVRAVDDSGNASVYSVGCAISLNKSTSTKPAFYVIDHMSLLYDEVSSLPGPININYNAIKGKSDMSDVNNSELSLVVASIDTTKGVIKKNNSSTPILVGDVIGKNDFIVWTPSSAFSGVVMPISFKVRNANSQESTVVVPLKATITKRP